MPEDINAAAQIYTIFSLFLPLFRSTHFFGLQFFFINTMGRSKRDVPDVTNYESIIDGLKTLYKRKIRPLEELYKFDLFHSAHLTDTDIAAKPFILVLGQYSVGKSSFVQYLLDRDYPGCHIGPGTTSVCVFVISIWRNRTDHG